MRERWLGAVGSKEGRDKGREKGRDGRMQKGREGERKE